jgi:hypothetical protein
LPISEAAVDLINVEENRQQLRLDVGDGRPDRRDSFC